MGVTMKDTVCGQLFFAVAHELGHAMFDIFDVPVFGRQEDAADEFATYIILQFGGEQALALIDGAAYGYHAYIQDLSTKPQVTLPLAAFSSDHGAPEERYFNLICIAYGYDERLFSGEMDKIPPGRAKKCKFEYEDLKFAMRSVFWPHLDHEKVRRVLAMKWFIDANANTSTAN
jgi:Putative metallopeptidase